MIKQSVKSLCTTSYFNCNKPNLVHGGFRYRIHDALDFEFMSQFIAHPFNKQLFDGSLSLNVFVNFVQLDKKYLSNLAKALRVVKLRLPLDQQHCLSHIESKILTTEQNMIEKYLHPHYLFSKKRIITSTLNECQPLEAYMDYQLNTARKEPVEVAVASFIPCFYIYRRLAKVALIRKQTDNPYQIWLNSYNSPQFIQATDALLDLTDELAFGASFARQEDMLHAVTKAARYELAFIDSVYSGKQTKMDTQSIPSITPDG